MNRPLRPALAAFAATLAVSSAASAADVLVVPVRPAAPGIVYVPGLPAVPRDPYDGEPILPLSVLSGPGYGLTGRDYYSDEASEHALRPPRAYRRASYRAAYR